MPTRSRSTGSLLSPAAMQIEHPYLKVEQPEAVELEREEKLEVEMEK